MTKLGGGMDMKYRGKNANTANLRRREGDTPKYYEESGAQRPSSLIHGFIQLTQWVSESGRFRQFPESGIGNC